MSVRRTMDESERQLIAELYPQLRRIAGVAGSFDIEPDDLVQEALVRTLSKRSLGELDNPLAYLRRTIVNLASNDRRRLARKRKAVARLSTDDGWVPSYPSDIRAILDIPPRQRAVLFLVEVEGMPYAEAAEQLGITTVAARALANRARRRAKLNLEVSSG